MAREAAGGGCCTCSVVTLVLRSMVSSTMGSRSVRGSRLGLALCGLLLGDPSGLWRELEALLLSSSCMTTWVRIVTCCVQNARFDSGKKSARGVRAHLAENRAAAGTGDNHIVFQIKVHGI